MKERMELIKCNLSLMDSYIKMAESSKRLYNHTKGRKGLYKILNRWAMMVNREAVKKGCEIFSKNLDLMNEGLEELTRRAQ